MLAVLIPVLGVVTAGSHVRPDGSPCGRFLRLSQQTLAQPEAVREAMLRVSGHRILVLPEVEVRGSVATV